MQTATTIAAEYMLARSLIFREAGGVKETYHFDWIGSARALTDASQVVIATNNYEAFGAVVGSTGSSGNAYKYDGAWRYRDDGDFGLLHVGARYYEPGVGRWVSEDTVADSINRYQYVHGHPTIAVDPTGLWGILGSNPIYPLLRFRICRGIARGGGKPIVNKCPKPRVDWQTIPPEILHDWLRSPEGTFDDLIQRTLGSKDSLTNPYVVPILQKWEA